MSPRTHDELAQRRERRELEIPDDVAILPSPQVPMEVARQFVTERYRVSDALTLRHWRGEWWEWRGSKWADIGHRSVRAAAYEFTERAVSVIDNKVKPWAPNRHKVADFLEALAAICNTSDDVGQPTWLDGGRGEPIVACRNGLLDVNRRVLYDHHPTFFNSVAVPFEYDADARKPTRWLRFLAQLWEGDEDSIAALAEWFGYVLSGRTDLQKILLVVGPTRGGKGAIARVLAALVGTENVAGPTLSSLSGEFGLAPLLGKPLAVVSDARLNGRDSSVVVERLLSISGEDRLTVNRKYRDQWTGTLPSRIMLLSNELPQLGDASAAIAGRFVTLLLTRSWLGKEDDTLEPELHKELPGILNWALDGLERLWWQQRFTRPTGADDAYRTLVDLASPVKAFIRDRCEVAPASRVSVDDVYAAWKTWAEDNGHGRKSKQTLGRDLRAALPHVRIVQPGTGDNRPRFYEGIALREAQAGE
jgi:putative DNA primase/helicase